MPCIAYCADCTLTTCTAESLCPFACCAFKLVIKAHTGWLMQPSRDALKDLVVLLSALAGNVATSFMLKVQMPDRTRGAVVLQNDDVIVKKGMQDSAPPALSQQGPPAAQTACHCYKELVHSRAGHSPTQQQQLWKTCSALSQEARPPSSWKPSSLSMWPCRLRNWKSGEWIQKGECWSSRLDVSLASQQQCQIGDVHHEQA